MTARVHVSASRQPKRVAGFGSQLSPTHTVQLSISFDLGDGAATVQALDDAVAEAKADIERTEGHGHSQSCYEVRA